MHHDEHHRLFAWRSLHSGTLQSCGLQVKTVTTFQTQGSVVAARCTTHGKGRLSSHSMVQVSYKTVEDISGCDVLFGKAWTLGGRLRTVSRDRLKSY